MLLWLASGPFHLNANNDEVRAFQHYLETDRALQTRSALLGALRWADAFRATFHRHGLPEDLMWIALVESGFQHDPTSPTGAQGIFQFKPETARAMGLNVDAASDERNSPLAAAEAAARYLDYLAQKFTSWELVLAAYNLGEGDLRRTMNARGAQTWHAVKPYVRQETQDYVGKVKAAALIGNRFLASPQAHDLRKQTIVTVRKGDTLYNLAKRHGTTVQAIQQHNHLADNHIFIGQNLVLPTVSN